jgi:hypothetical protein
MSPVHGAPDLAFIERAVALNVLELIRGWVRGRSGSAAIRLSLKLLSLSSIQDCRSYFAFGARRDGREHENDLLRAGSSAGTVFCHLN